MALILRRAGEADRPALLRLLRTCFDGWHGEASEQVAQWKFERCPHGEAKIWVAEADDRLAGCYVWNPVMLSVGDTVVSGTQSIDAAVHPDFQGQGLFTRLAQTAVDAATEEGIELVFAFPNPQALHGQIRVGFESGPSVVKTGKLLVARRMSRRRFPGLALAEPAEFDERFSRFNSGDGGAVSLHRDPAYLNWRYRDCPIEAYETISCERDGELCGYCVINVRKPPGSVTRGYLVDLQVLPGFGDAADFLVHHGVSRLRDRGARLAISWARLSEPENEALDRAGFRTRYERMRRRVQRDGYDAKLIFLPHSPRLAAIPGWPDKTSALRWDIVPGDADYM